MSHAIIARALQSLTVLVLVALAAFAMISLMPGDPVDQILSTSPDIRPEDIERLRRVYGLDQPWFERFASWAGGALEADFGYSRLYAKPVSEVLIDPLLRTLVLISASLVIAFLIALPVGILAALYPRSPFDYAVNLFAFAGLSMPVFWLGLLLIILFAVTLGWLPPGGVATAGGEDAIDRIRHLVLPVMTLSIVSIGQHSRYIRAAMLEALSADHIRTARAKGANRRRVVLHHALRQAMIPVATILALDMGTLFSGALITETVFSYPGMGKLLFDAIMGNDTNLALAALLIATVMTLLGNILADIAYLALDPRIGRR